MNLGVTCVCNGIQVGMMGVGVPDSVDLQFASFWLSTYITMTESTIASESVAKELQHSASASQSNMETVDSSMKEDAPESEGSAAESEADGATNAPSAGRIFKSTSNHNRPNCALLSGKKKKKKPKKKSKKLTQTDPPTVPVHKIFSSGNYPIGEEEPYLNEFVEFNSYRRHSQMTDSYLKQCLSDFIC